MKFLVTLGTGNASIEPDPPVESLKQFEYSAQVAEPIGPGGYLVTRELIKGWRRDPNSKLLLPTPLMPWLIDNLRMDGNRVKVRDLRQPPERLVFDEEVLSETRGEERVLAKAIQSHDRAQLEVRSFEDTLNLIALIAQLYPFARILILVPSQTQARDSVWHLRQKHQLRVRLRGTSQWPTAQRLLISTFGPFRFWSQTHPDEKTEKGTDHDWDVVLLPDPLRSLSSVACNAMAKFSCLDCNVYSFIPQRANLSRGDRIVLTAICGRLAYTIPGARVGTQMLWVDVPTGKIVSGTPLEWKRGAYVHNARRNQFVAAVARAFSRGDIGKLKKYGVRVRNDTPDTRGGKTPSVAVLVESTEHGRELQNLLGWPLFSYPGDTTEKQHEQTPGCIVTAIRLPFHGRASPTNLAPSCTGSRLTV
jgi:hypothetical protein